MDVFLTIDTEASMGGAWGDASLAPLDIDTCVWCKLPRAKLRDGRYAGAGLIMDMLEAHGLPGVFLVDTAMRFFGDPAKFDDCCRQIASRGHDVQLHLHPAARQYPQAHGGGSIPSDDIRRYSLDRQRELLEEACQTLASATGKRPVAFRAGNYSADANTLRALAACGVKVDFSYNAAYMGNQCGLGEFGLFNSPRRIEGVLEVPVSQLRQPRGRTKPLEVNAISAAEMCSALDQLNAAGVAAVCIVLHSFSLLKHRKNRFAAARPDDVVIARLAKLAKFLGENTDRFQTRRIADCVAEPQWEQAVAQGPDAWPRTNILATAARYAGQLMSYL